MNRTWMKGVLAVLLIATCTAGAFAQSPEDFDVAQNADNTITITGYKGTVKDVVIPARLYNRNVTRIGGGAFTSKGLTSVVIPDTVTVIEMGSSYYGAFGDNQLAKVTLGKGLTVIGMEAFRSNETLTEITIPDSVTKIDSHAFSDCGLTRIVWGKGLKIIEQTTFASNQLKTLIIPEGVTRIEYQAFSGNPIEVLNIPASLASRGSNVVRDAFSASSLVCVTLPANMDSVGALGDSSLANFYISQDRAAGVYIKNGPVWDKGTIAQVNQIIKEREDAVKAAAAAKIAAEAEAAAAKIAAEAKAAAAKAEAAAEAEAEAARAVAVAEARAAAEAKAAATKAVADRAFADAVKKSGFTVAVFEDGTLVIAGYTARSKDVVIPAEIGGKAVVGIGEAAFRPHITAGDITSVVIPDSVVVIGNSAFSNYIDRNRNTVGRSKLASVKWGTGLRSIGREAFGENRALKIIESGTANSQTDIGYDSFPDDFISVWYSSGDRPRKYTHGLLGWR